MKIKLDENLGTRGADLLRAAGHDVATVADESLFGVDDVRVAAVCRDEQRCLITLDMHFGDPLQFKPTDYCGLVILRPPPRVSLDNLLGLIKTFITAAGNQSLDKKLWIVQQGTIREYQPPD